MSDIAFRMADAHDAPFLARTIAVVSEGVLAQLLDNVLPGISSEAILEMVLRDGSSHYSYKNCVLAERDGESTGLLFAYDAAYQSIPKLMRATIEKRRIDPLEDLLTASVAESLYINTFWVSEAVRGLGLSDTLMDYAKEWAKALSLQKLSLFVFHDNGRAREFYRRHGFTVYRSVQLGGDVASRHGGGDLMVCEIDESSLGA